MGFKLVLCCVVLACFWNFVSAEIMTVDMSYDYEENVTFYWVHQWSYTRTPSNGTGYRTVNDKTFWVENWAYFTGEHGGTHIDAPKHFAKNGWTIEQIPLSNLLQVPLAVVDIRTQAGQNIDYLATVEDFKKWEQEHGRIPEKGAVFINTGMGRFYPNRTAFTGTSTPDDNTNVMNFHYPGFHPEAAEWLATKRKIYGVATDAISIDHGPSRDFRAHVSILTRNIWAGEIVKNMDKVPASGARVTALPMKLKGGSGAPSRIYATWNTNPSASSSVVVNVLQDFLFLSLVHLISPK